MRTVLKTVEGNTSLSSNLSTSVFDITVTVIFIVVSWIGHIFDLLKIRYYHLPYLLLDLDVVGVSIL